MLMSAPQKTSYNPNRNENELINNHKTYHLGSIACSCNPNG
uniref:Uncharacterized protein n=1 Tax=Anguilla anguilla TaxID=7936 RepID=A0A0E9REQ6_ANGAN